MRCTVLDYVILNHAQEVKRQRIKHNETTHYSLLAMNGLINPFSDENNMYLPSCFT